MPENISEISRRRFIVASVAMPAFFMLPGQLFARESYQQIRVLHGATLKGRVVYNGKPPKPDKILIAKDNDHCGNGHVNPDPVFLTSDGYVSAAIVAIKGITAGKAWPQKLKSPQIVQQKCSFHPYIQVARKNAELTIINKDPLLHNIHGYELIGRVRRSLFNIAQPAADQIDKKILKARRGNRIEVDCDAHNWMSAWIYLSDHPYVSLTDESGRYSLPDIPPGDYEIITWHPVLGSQQQPLSIIENKTSLDLDIEIQAT